MKHTDLIQRLARPRSAAANPVSPFAFGGGLKNGGLSNDALKLLTGVCSFDYMGSSEFEWGAVPDALQRMAAVATNKQLELWNVRVGHYAPRVASSQNTHKEHHEWDTILVGEEIYVLGDISLREEIDRRICELAVYDGTIIPCGWGADTAFFGLKEASYLQRALYERLNGKPQEFPCSVVGWLELDNGFIFSIDANMTGAFADLFEIPADKRHCVIK